MAIVKKKYEQKLHDLVPILNKKKVALYRDVRLQMCVCALTLLIRRIIFFFLEHVADIRLLATKLK